jgi:hypothetical protein
MQKLGDCKVLQFFVDYIFYLVNKKEATSEN